MQTLPHHTWVIEWSFSHVKHSFGACMYAHTETHAHPHTACTYTLTLVNTLKKGFFTLGPRLFVLKWPGWWTFASSAIFLYYCYLLFFFHRRKLTKDREIKRKIASKRLAKFSSKCSTQPKLWNATAKQHQRNWGNASSALELKFTALKSSFSVKPTSLSDSCEKAGRQTPAFARWAAFGKEEKISPSRQRKSRLPDNSVKTLLLFLEPA